MKLFKGKKYEVRMTSMCVYFYVIYDQSGDEEYISPGFPYAKKESVELKAKKYIENIQ